MLKQLEKELERTKLESRKLDWTQELTPIPFFDWVKERNLLFIKISNLKTKISNLKSGKKLNGDPYSYIIINESR